MIVSIFSKLRSGKFNRVELDVVKFNKNTIIIQRGRNIIRMKLQDTSKQDFFSLLTSDVIHVYVEDENFSKAYIMPNVKDYILDNLDLSLEHQDYLRRIEEKNTKELAAIDDNIRYIITNSSDVRTEKFQTISEALFLAITEPKFLQELRTRLKSVEV
jgi:hypothetical protein